MIDLAKNPLAADADLDVLLTSVPDELEVLEALTLTFGQKFAELFGTHATRLTAPLEVGDTSAAVESTLLWRSSGKLAIGGVLVTYTGKTKTTLTGLSWPDVAAEIFPAGAAVEDASRRFSSVDQARADMLAVSAEGAWLDVVARSYGEGRPWPMSDDTFRALLLVLIYLDRGTWLAVHRVLDKALADYRTVVTDGVTNSGSPQRYTSAGGTPFTSWHVHRYARVAGKLHRIVRVDAGGAWVDLAAGGGPWWQGATFGDATGVRLEILPFTQEVDPDVYPGQVVINAFLPATFTDVPPTYLQPAGANPTPPGVHKGGQLMPDENTAGGPGTQPLYLSGGASKLVADLVLDVLAHGIVPVVKLGQP